MATALQAGLAPIGSAQAEVLILGSMPSVASLQAQAYYAHPRNAFWRIIETVFSAEPNSSYEQRCDLLARHRIKVWDVIAQAKRQGSLDSAIETSSVSINDFDFLRGRDCAVQRILCNGAKAHQLFNKHVAKAQSLTQAVYLLPSTSPANAATSFEQKLQAWQAVLPSNESG